MLHFRLVRKLGKPFSYEHAYSITAEYGIPISLVVVFSFPLALSNKLTNQKSLSLKQLR